MKEVVDRLIKEGIVFKELKEIKINTRKKIRAFLGVNIKNEYVFVLVVDKKSRILLKDIKEILEILPEINFKYKKKILFLKAPICFRAKEIIKDWRIFWF